MVGGNFPGYNMQKAGHKELMCYHRFGVSGPNTGESRQLPGNSQLKFGSQYFLSYLL